MDDLSKMHNNHGTICYNKVFDRLLPTTAGDLFYKLIAARMSKYMVCIMKED
jgi:hypothetical protein